jgi:UDP-xylose/UDP-N-acetylglucosamine transporter B4
MLTIAQLFLGCALNGIVLEMIVNYDKGCGPLLTFLQTLFITVMSLHWERPKTPLWFYGMITLIFWCVGLLNNVAFNYHITQPIHMVARSSSLAASYIIGYCFFGQSVGDMRRFLSVVAVTLGIFIVIQTESFVKSETFQSCSTDLASCPITPRSDANELTFEWLIGCGILFVTLMLSALLGHLQQWGYKRWGKDVKEGQFYTHLLSLVYFVFMVPNMREHWALWTQQPIVWVWVGCNVVTQYVCIAAVYRSIGESGALTTTLLLTVRKFFSLFFSVWYFNNLFLINHWVGSFLVFLGCLIYQYTL